MVEKNGYYHPASFENGKEYLLQIKNGSGKGEYKKVLFLGYRAHPGELIVRVGERSRKVYRVDLFQRGKGC